MLEKTMNLVLKKKISEWLRSIEDKNLVKKIENSIVVTGGCFTSFLIGEKPKDYDLYLRDQESVIAISNYYIKKFKEKHKDQEIDLLVEDSSGGFVNYSILEERTPMKEGGRVKIFIPSSGVASQLEEQKIENLELGEDPLDLFEEPEETEDEKYRPVFLSSNAITLSDKIQIVVRFYGEPEKIHETYDFVHTKAYWTSWDKEVVIPKEVYQSVLNRVLTYTGSRYPLASLVRMRKFIKRGWRINAGQILKISMQLSELDLTDIKVLEDQLVGVDSLYFSALIEQFKRKEQSDESFVLSSSYISSIIDKIF
jgi:hypothetical protein